MKVKSSIPFSQFLRLRHLCSDDSDFSEKSEAMCQFFDKRGYPVSVVQAGHHRAQQIDTRHYNRLRRKTLIAFHSISHFTLTTTQLDLTFFKTLELDGDHRFTFLTELLTLIYLSYSPTDAASQFLWKLSPFREGTFFLGGGGEASDGRVISESEHQRGRAIPSLSAIQGEGHTFSRIFNGDFCDVIFHFSLID